MKKDPLAANMKNRELFAVENWWDATLIISFMFLMLVGECLGKPMTETQLHVLFLMIAFYLYDEVAIFIWKWSYLYEVKPEVIRSDEDSKVVPLDIVKWLLGLKV